MAYLSKLLPPGAHRASGFVTAILAATVLLAGCDALKSADSRVAAAERQMAQGDYRAATIQLKSVLERKPNHSGARVALARLSVKLGDLETARKELDRAFDAGASREGLTGLDAEIEIGRGHFAEAATRLQADRTLPAVRRFILLAAARQGAGDLTAATSSLAEARKLAPADAAVLLQGARLAIARQRFDEALGAADAAIERDPQLSEAWLLRGRLNLQKRDFKGAIADLTRASENAPGRLTTPQELECLMALAEAQIGLNDKEAVAAIVQKLKSRFPGQPLTHYLQARLALFDKDYRTAIAELQQVTRTVPDHVPARLLLGASLLGQGTLEQAEAQLAQLLSQHPENLEARKLLAQVHIARGNPGLAEQVLGESDIQDAWTDQLMGTALLQSGSAEEGLSHLERSLAAAPGNMALRLQLARIYLSAGRREETLKVLEPLPAGQRDAKVQQLIVLANIAGKPGPEAKRALEQLAERNDKDPQLLGVAGGYALAGGDAVLARKYLNASLALDPENSLARLSLAQLEAREGRTEAAERELRTVLKSDPKRQDARIALASLIWKRGDRAGARRELEQAVSADPSAVEARLRLAQLAFAEKDSARAQALLNQAAEVSHHRPEVMNAAGEILLGGGHYDAALSHFQSAVKSGLLAVSLNIVRAQLALNRPEDARRTLEAYEQALPKPVPPKLAALVYGVRRMLAQHYQRAGNSKIAIAVYEQLVRMPAAQSDPITLNNLAWLYFETGDLRALELARKAHDLAPKSPEIADTYGWILVGRGKTREGLSMLETAAVSAPDNRDIQEHLAAARRLQDSAGSGRHR